MPMANVGLLVAVLCNVNGTWCVLSFSVSVSATTPVHHQQQQQLKMRTCHRFPHDDTITVMITTTMMMMIVVVVVGE